jgi:hypothetical protein
MSHKFGLGQTVLFTPSGVEVLETVEVGTVTRLLPKEGKYYQYRVHITADDTERRASENQLKPMAT